MLVDKKLKITRQCELAAQKVTHALGCAKSSLVSRMREVILSLCPSLVRPPSGVVLWSALRTQHNKDMDVLKQVQRRPQRLSRA